MKPILLALVCLCLGCTSIKKSLSRTKQESTKERTEQVDSVRVIKKDSTTIAKSEQVIITTDSSAYEKQTDEIITEVKTKDTTTTITKRSIKEKGARTARKDDRDVRSAGTDLKTSDSTGKATKSYDSAHELIKQLDKNKETKKLFPGWALFLIVVIIVLGGGYLIRKKFNL